MSPIGMYFSLSNAFVWKPALPTWRAQHEEPAVVTTQKAGVDQ